jgi:hypothetical protein
MTDAAVLTDRFDRALLYATHVHGGQVRKGTFIPYIAHLLAVAATVLEYNGSEDMAIAALLHDAVEDQGGEPRLTHPQPLLRSSYGYRALLLGYRRQHISRPAQGRLAHPQNALPRTPRSLSDYETDFAGQKSASRILLGA